ncbi:MAG: hypothetical protein M1830_001250 [Pleopsidium flavum]|nr:MAG: hypothetical protein M1830_001250 [Pleopsidium flavum]
MAYLRFPDLSLDLKSLIISYIDRPTDLKSLCLTSKDVRDVAVRELYRNVSFDMGSHKDVHVSSFLARDNPGLPYVREIAIHLLGCQNSSSAERNAQIRQAHFVVRLLLDHLPSDILEAFRWQTWKPFSAKNFLLLCKRQKHLRCIELGPTDEDLMPIIEQKPDFFKPLDQVLDLELYPANLDGLEVSQRFLHSVTRLDSLTICSGFHTTMDSLSDLDDSSTQPGLLTRTIFSHMRPFENCTPMTLKTLVLEKINLRYVSSSYMKVIKMAALEFIEIRKCPGADALFSELSKPHQRPLGLKTLRFYHHDDDQHYGLVAVEGFLQSTSGLVTLHIDIDNASALPKEDCVTRHSKTLTSLSINSQNTSYAVYEYSSGAFDKICTACTGLRQLSVTFPETSALDAFGSQAFEAFLHSTRQIDHLRTLNIRRWPTLGYGSALFDSDGDVNSGTLMIYEHLLQRMAQDIFDTANKIPISTSNLSPPSKLSVIAFGSNGQSAYEVDHKLTQISFVRGKKLDPFGKAQMLAFQTKRELVQFVEPECDILSYSMDNLDGGI